MAAVWLIGGPAPAAADEIAVAPAAEFILLTNSQSGLVEYLPLESYDPLAGTATFGQRQLLADLGASSAAGVGDFDGDGDLDVTASAARDGNQQTFDVYFLENLGTHFDRRAIESGIVLPVSSLTGFTPTHTRHGVTDVDGDGDLDFVLAIYGSTAVFLYRNDGNAAFARSQLPPLGNPEDVIPGDFDGDGDDDLLLSEYFNNRFVRYENDGTGSFTAAGTAIQLSSASHRSFTATAGDFNEDGKLDAITTSSGPVALHLGDGSGSFASGSSLGLGGAWITVASFDADHDGHTDLLSGIYFGAGGGNVYFHRGSGAGTFSSPTVVGSGTLAGGQYGPYVVAPAQMARRSDILFVDAAYYGFEDQPPHGDADGNDFGAVIGLCLQAEPNTDGLVTTRNLCAEIHPRSNGSGSVSATLAVTLPIPFDAANTPSITARTSDFGAGPLLIEQVEPLTPFGRDGWLGVEIYSTRAPWDFQEGFIETDPTVDHSPDAVRVTEVCFEWAEPVTLDTSAMIDWYILTSEGTEVHLEENWLGPGEFPRNDDNSPAAIAVPDDDFWWPRERISLLYGYPDLALQIQDGVPRPWYLHEHAEIGYVFQADANGDPAPRRPSFPDSMCRQRGECLLDADCEAGGICFEGTCQTVAE